MKCKKGSSLGREKLAFWPDSVAHVTPESDRATLPEFALPIHLRAQDGMALVDVTGLVALADWSGSVQNRAEWIAAANACRGRGMCVPALPETLYVRPDGTLCLIALPYDEPSPGSPDVLANLPAEEETDADEFDSFMPAPDEFDSFMPDAGAPETAAPAEPAEALPDAPANSAPSFTPPSPAFAPGAPGPEPEPSSESDIWSSEPFNLDFSHPVLEPASAESKSDAGFPRVDPTPAVEAFPNLNVPEPFSFDIGGAAPSTEGSAADAPGRDDSSNARSADVAPIPIFSRNDRKPPRNGGGKGEPERGPHRGFLGLGGGKPKRKPPENDPLDDLFLDVPAASKLASGSLYLSKKRGTTRGAIPIPKDERVTLGRTAAKARIVLPHRDVSELHASISFEHGAYFLTDDGSSYGTWLNGVQLVKGEPQRIDPMAEIRFASNRYYAVFEED